MITSAGHEDHHFSRSRGSSLQQVMRMITSAGHEDHHFSRSRGSSLQQVMRMIKTVGGDIGMTHSAGHEDDQDCRW